MCGCSTSPTSSATETTSPTQASLSTSRRTLPSHCSRKPTRCCRRARGRPPTSSTNLSTSKQKLLALSTASGEAERPLRSLRFGSWRRHDLHDRWHAGCLRGRHPPKDVQINQLCTAPGLTKTVSNFLRLQKDSYDFPIVQDSERMGGCEAAENERLNSILHCENIRWLFN